MAAVGPKLIEFSIDVKPIFEESFSLMGGALSNHIRKQSE